jgi:hypothetical protein
MSSGPVGVATGAFYELENMLGEQDLDPADELRVRDELEALREDPTRTRRSRRSGGRRSSDSLPDCWTSVERIVESIATAGIKGRSRPPVGRGTR